GSAAARPTTLRLGGVYPDLDQPGVAADVVGDHTDGGSARAGRGRGAHVDTTDVLGRLPVAEAVLRPGHRTVVDTVRVVLRVAGIERAHVGGRLAAGGGAAPGSWELARPLPDVLAAVLRRSAQARESGRSGRDDPLERRAEFRIDTGVSRTHGRRFAGVGRSGAQGEQRSKADQR